MHIKPSQAVLELSGAINANYPIAGFAMRSPSQTPCARAAFAVYAPMELACRRVIVEKFAQPLGGKFFFQGKPLAQHNKGGRLA